MTVVDDVVEWGWGGGLLFVSMRTCSNLELGTTRFGYDEVFVIWHCASGISSKLDQVRGNALAAFSAQ